MGYDGMRRHVQQLKIDQKLIDLIKENLVIASEAKITLNDEGVEKIKDIIGKDFLVQRWLILLQ